MKKMLKDVTQFGIANVALGGMGIAAGNVGGGAGLTGLSKMMPAMGSVVAAKNIIRITGKMLPKRKRR